MNAVFLIVAINKSLKPSKSIKSNKNSSSLSMTMEMKWKNAFRRIFGAISLIFALGIIWLSGFFFWNDKTFAFSYIFVILNALQGVIIFFTYFLFSKYVNITDLRRRYASNPVGIILLEAVNAWYLCKFIFLFRLYIIRISGNANFTCCSIKNWRIVALNKF